MFIWAAIRPPKSTKTENFQLKTILKFLFVISLIFVSAALLISCGNNGEQTLQPDAGIINIGEGSTVFRFEKDDGLGNITAWDVATDEPFLAEALLANNLIDGVMENWGFFVTTVNGETLDNGFWRFFVDDALSNTGVSATEVVAGRTYAFAPSIRADAETGPT